MEIEFRKLKNDELLKQIEKYLDKWKNLSYYCIH